jgi:hypothetical protein
LTRSKRKRGNEARSPADEEKEQGKQTKREREKTKEEKREKRRKQNSPTGEKEQRGGAGEGNTRDNQCAHTQTVRRTGCSKTSKARNKTKGKGSDVRRERNE